MIGAPGSPAFPVFSPVNYTGVKMGVIAWDGIIQSIGGVAPGWSASAGLDKYFPSNGKYNCRKPSYWHNGAISGDGVDVQSIVNERLCRLSRAVDFIFYVWYPDAAKTPQLSQIMNAYAAHMASPFKSKVKFAFIIQWFYFNFSSGAYRTEFSNWFRDQTLDPAYMKIDGAPLFALYNDGWTSQAAAWTAFKGIVGSTYALGLVDNTMFVNLGLQGLMCYGPNRSGGIPSDGRKPWTTLVTSDQSTWTMLPGAARIVNMTPILDRRPVAATSRFYDKPSRPALLAHVQNAQAQVSPAPKVMPIYADSEICEGGNPEDVGLYDVCEWARGYPKPQSYTYELSLSSSATSGTNNAVIQTGTGWTNQFLDPSGIQGAHDNDEQWTSTAGDALELHNHDRLIGFEIVGSRLPGGGSADVQVNGSSVGTVSFSGTSAVRQTLFSYTLGGTPATGSVKLIANGDGQIRPDSIRIKYKP